MFSFIFDLKFLLLGRPPPPAPLKDAAAAGFLKLGQCQTLESQI